MWEVVDLFTRLKERCTKAHRFVNGRFEHGNSHSVYYTCTSHEGCKCYYRVSFCVKHVSRVVAIRDHLDHENGE